MTNLTEKWIKGELPSGFYYIRRGLSKRIDMSYLGGAFFEGNIEVILPVPSYEQWQAKLEENTKLKKLLKQYKEDILNDCDWYIDAGEKIKQINQVLGE